jgi:phosphoribosylformimino-5-aminoimidazole carboxamide ribotide isomerase
VRIYGVFDLQAGEVVQGRAGRRDSYRPVRSVLAGSADPAEVARGMVKRLDLQAAYVADLNAIAGQDPDFHALGKIAASGLELLVDAGCADVDRARALGQFRAPSGPLAGIVIGLETLAGEATLPQLLDELGAERAVFSLDLRAGAPWSRCERLLRESPQRLADLAWQAGFRRIIVLDVAAVGSGSGPVTVEMCRQLRGGHGWRELITGGGVRDVQDLRQLHAAGCDAALVASALHTGAIGLRELRALSATRVDPQAAADSDHE